MRTEPYDSIIFDLDGTLWDATPACVRAWSKITKLLEIDIEIDEAKIMSVSGLPFTKCVEVIFGKHAQMNTNLASLINEAERVEIIQSGGRFYPDMVEGILKLSKQYKLYIVSNCEGWYLDSFLEHSKLRSCFSDTLCFGQTNRPKNENIKEIVMKNSLKGAVYFGDTECDREASMDAGVDFVFASFGFGKMSSSCISAESFKDFMKIMSID